MTNRQIQIDDFVFISGADINDKYIIRNITPKGIYISTDQNPEHVSLLYWTGSHWDIHGTSEGKYQLKFMGNSELISNSHLSELPIEILHETIINLKLSDIINLCSTNKYLNEKICKNDVFWKKKYILDYDDRFRDNGFVENFKELYMKTYNFFPNKKSLKEEYFKFLNDPPEISYFSMILYLGLNGRFRENYFSDLIYPNIVFNRETLINIAGDNLRDVIHDEKSDDLPLDNDWNYYDYKDYIDTYIKNMTMIELKDSIEDKIEFEYDNDYKSLKDYTDTLILNGIFFNSNWELLSDDDLNMFAVIYRINTKQNRNDVIRDIITQQKENLREIALNEIKIETRNIDALKELSEDNSVL